ncbi:thioredoxin domain-containing protein [Novosphingobium sp. PY1]|uniref:DsbA family protein n=1 Tax=Novosphingobium sp. PY1 TaxID=1882221 RepID=UPI001A8F08F8|nr:thioredoxin domain-containing protein [Novosphingobium sp. PY1]GFM28314.1 protein-disulfide isomerase [Novosphingobium sp. PY1]
MKPSFVKSIARNAARTIALASCAALSLAASPPQPAPKPTPTAKARQQLAAKGNWNGTMGVTADGSHTLGNPDAPIKMTEFVSYTCPHCAVFHREADPVLRTTLIPKGQIQVTVTNLLRNPIDLTIAMLTSCGDPNRFWVRHNAFFASQDQWLATAQKMTPEQLARWGQGEIPARMRAIAGDLGFYAKMQQWGIDRARADRCLNDAAMLDKLRAQQSAAGSLGLTGTPSFVINGEVQQVHDWEHLSKLLSDRAAALQAGRI